jgi:hypothetical protein
MESRPGQGARAMMPFRLCRSPKSAHSIELSCISKGWPACRIGMCPAYPALPYVAGPAVCEERSWISGPGCRATPRIDPLATTKTDPPPVERIVPGVHRGDPVGPRGRSAALCGRDLGHGLRLALAGTWAGRRSDKIELRRRAANFPAPAAGHRPAAGCAAAAEDRPQIIDMKDGIAAPATPTPAAAAADSCSVERRGGTKPAGGETKRRVRGTKRPVGGTKIVPVGTRLEQAVANSLP